MGRYLLVFVIISLYFQSVSILLFIILVTTVFFPIPISYFTYTIPKYKHQTNSSKQEDNTRKF